MLNAALRRIHVPRGKRLLAVSDLHGHGHLLQRLLEKAHYSPETDILVIVGDFIEKGPDSLGTLRFLMRLCQAGPVYPLIGNVDHWRYSLLMSEDAETQKKYVENAMMFTQWWPSSWLHEMCREAGYEVAMDMDTQTIFPILRACFAKEIAFLESLPTFLETDDLIFVHGGIPHERLKELEDTPRNSYLKWDHFMDDGLSFQKYIVVGHWPTALNSDQIAWYNPIVNHRQHIIAIDGGCGVKEDGQLNLVIFPEGRAENLSFLSCHDLPMVVAENAQEASPDSRFIHWGDDIVTVLEKGGELSRVLHRGLEMQVPTAHLYERNGEVHCSDVCNHILAVSPGDELAIITRLSDRCYVKKDGVHGWYFGKFK